MTSEVGSKPSGRAIIEETLGHLKTFTLVARVTLVGQFGIQVVKHLQIIGNNLEITDFTKLANLFRRSIVFGMRYDSRRTTVVS